jgi:hypothetical protein
MDADGKVVMDSVVETKAAISAAPFRRGCNTIPERLHYLAWTDDISLVPQSQ